MRHALAIPLVLALGACSFNAPFLSPASEDQVEEFGEVGPIGTNLQIPAGSVIVPAMTRAEAQPGLRGTLVVAEGVTPTQGYYNAFLLPMPTEEDGVFVFEFRVLAPRSPQLQSVGPERTRRVTASAFLSVLEMRGVRAIRIVAGNTVTIPTPRAAAPRTEEPLDLMVGG